MAVEQVTTKKKATLILNVDGCIAACFVDLLRDCGAFDKSEADELRAQSSALRASLQEARRAAARAAEESDGAHALARAADSRSHELSHELAKALAALRDDVAAMESARQSEASQAASQLVAAATERDLALQQSASLRRALAEATAAVVGTPPAPGSVMERAMRSLLVES
jgi:hypothetical protein